jgi:hypothetical protein
VLVLECVSVFLCLRLVGPIDCANGSYAYNKAFFIAGHLDPPLEGPSDGPQDAVRHCIGACLTGILMGPVDAKQVGDIHEVCGRGKPESNCMDLYNNAIGRRLSAGSENVDDCKNACLKALADKELQDHKACPPGDGTISPPL